VERMPFVVGLCDPIRVAARGAVIAQATAEHIQQDPVLADPELADLHFGGANHASAGNPSARPTVAAEQ
jgi:hypothetical protein